ncbi:MAG: nuclear transport factor 2 family protein [Acidobacteria bacterium]|nr:nuclear transport factor 2 family protein [Acidobacteriota bacterium]
MTNGPVEKLFELAAPGIKGYQGSQVAEGHEALAAYAKHYRQAYPGWKLAIERMVAEGPWVAVQGVSTGKGLELRFAALYKVSRGRVSEVHLYGEPGSLQKSLSLVP